MNNLSSKAIKRLSLYHCILRDYISQKKQFISSAQIALLLKVDDSQVRKDIALCHVSGRASFGYPVFELKQAIEKNLGFKDPKHVFIVGAGNLGFALAKYDDFKSYGVDILALFDNNIKKVGQSVNQKNIYDIQDLPIFIKKYDVETVILTVPPSQAQTVCDFLVKSGVHYIWNFTQTVLSVPDTVSVVYENLIGHFYNLNK